MAFTQTTIIIPGLLADNPTFAVGSVVESPTVSPGGRWSRAGDANAGTFAATDRYRIRTKAPIFDIVVSDVVIEREHTAIIK